MLQSSGILMWIFVNRPDLVPISYRGQEIPIHPLDLTSPTVLAVNSTTNITYCANTYVNGTSVLTELECDLVLGDTFLRNVYALFNYGQLAGWDQQQAVEDAYIQLLPRTDPQLALSDFNSSRSKEMSNLPPDVFSLGTNTTDGTTTASGTTSESAPSASPTSPSTKSSSAGRVVTARWSVASLVGMAALFFIFA